MADRSGIEEKITILEQKNNFIEKKYEEFNIASKELSFAVDELKLKIAQQNGILPRIEKSVSEINTKFDSFDHRLDEQNTKLQFVSIRVKILWAAAATIAGGILLAALTLIVERLFS